MADSLARILLQTVVDQAGQRIFNNTVKQMEGRLDDLIAANVSVGQSAQESGDLQLKATKSNLSTTERLANQSARIKAQKQQEANVVAAAAARSANSYDAERAALLGVADAAQQAADAKKEEADAGGGTPAQATPQYGGLLSRSESGLNNIRQVFGGSSDVGEVLNIGADVIGAGRAIQEFKTQASELTSTISGAGGLTGAVSGMIGPAAVVGISLAAIGAALALIVLAAKAYNDSLKDTRVKLEAVLSTQKEYYDLLQTGTSEEAQAALKNAEQQRKSLEGQRDEAQRVIDQTFKGLQDNLGDTAARAVFGRLQVSELKDYYQAIDDTNKAITTQDIAIGRLKGSLEGGAFAANNAAAAFAKQSQANIDAVEKQRGFKADAIEFGRSGSSDALKERQRAINDSLQSYQDAIKLVNQQVANGTTEATAGAAAVAGYFTSIADLNVQQRLLTEISKPLIEAREREAKAMEFGKKVLDGITEAFNDAIQKRQDAIRDEISTDQDYAEQLRTGSSEGIKSRLASLADEKAAIEKQLPALTLLAAAGGENAKTLLSYQDRLKKIDDSTKELTNDILPAIKAREDEAAAAEKVKEAEKDYADSLLRTAALYGEIVQAQQDFADDTKALVADRAKADRRDQEDFARARAKATKEFWSGIAESDKSFYEDRAKSLAQYAEESATEENNTQKERIKALQEHNKESIRNAEDLQRTLVEIERNTKKAVGEAAANLDARSVLAAQQSGQEQATEAVDNYNLEKRRRDEDFIQQLNEAAAQAEEAKQQRAKQFAEQQAEADANYQITRAKQIAQFQQGLAEEDADRAFTRARELEDRAEQDAARAAAQKKTLDGLRKQLDDETNLRVQKQSVIQQNTTTFLSGLVSSFSSAFAQIQAAQTRVTAPPRSTTPTRPSSPYVPVRGRGFAEGGEPPVGVPVRVGERGAETAVFTSPVRIYSAADSQRFSRLPVAGGGNGRTLNVNGTTIQINADLGNFSEPKLKSMFYDAVVEMAKQAS